MALPKKLLHKIKPEAVGLDVVQYLQRMSDNCTPDDLGEIIKNMVEIAKSKADPESAFEAGEFIVKTFTDLMKKLPEPKNLKPEYRHAIPVSREVLFEMAKELQKRQRSIEMKPVEQKEEPPAPG